MVSDLPVRWMHVVGMALLFGGAALTWGAFRTADEPPLAVAVAYEWLFWLGAGVLVATGVGNLGSLAPAVPAPGTAWGLAFGLKLLAAVGLLVGSAVRTLAVVRWSSLSTLAPADARRLRASYAATTGYLLAVVALAEVLAHG